MLGLPALLGFLAAEVLLYRSHRRGAVAGLCALSFFGAGFCVWALLKTRLGLVALLQSAADPQINMAFLLARYDGCVRVLLAVALCVVLLQLAAAFVLKAELVRAIFIPVSLLFAALLPAGALIAAAGSGTVYVDLSGPFAAAGAACAGLLCLSFPIQKSLSPQDSASGRHMP